MYFSSSSGLKGQAVLALATSCRVDSRTTPSRSEAFRIFWRSPSDAALFSCRTAPVSAPATFTAASAARSASANPCSNVNVSSILSQFHASQCGDVLNGPVEIPHHDNLLRISRLQVLNVVRRQSLDLLGSLLDRQERFAL